jgi:hypothetical protein
VSIYRYSDTYAVEYTVELAHGASSIGPLNGRVVVTDGYSTLADIPRILAAKDGWQPGQILVRKLEFVGRESIANDSFRRPVAQGPVYTLAVLRDDQHSAGWPKDSRWQQVYANPAERVQLA